MPRRLSCVDAAMLGPVSPLGDAANEIADDLNLIGVVIHDFDVGEQIFDQRQQFETIKPVGPKVMAQVRIVRNATEVDTKLLGDKRTNL